FPANASFPAVLGELLSAGLGINGMLWSTSPAATELETHVLDWLVDLLDLPGCFKGAGVIQDTASSASLCSLLCGREQTMGRLMREEGGFESETFSPVDAVRSLRVYTSDQAHSSIEKAVKIAGMPRESMRFIPSDPETFAMDIGALEAAVESDIMAGFTPCYIAAATGTTSSLAMDPLRQIGELCRRHEIWLHVDAAMAGTALICPEFRHIADGLEYADSFCFNPHKWMFTNFDCDAFYVRDPERLTRTLSVLPEYLRANQSDEVINYRDWHIPLGRRFRALKLWFVLRHYGAEGIRRHVRRHVELARWFADQVEADREFELAAPVSLNLVCFRFIDNKTESDQTGGGAAGEAEAAGGGPPPSNGISSAKGDDGGRQGEARAAELARLDRLNRAIMDRLNAAGDIHLTHTKLNDRFTLRMSIGQTRTEHEHVADAWRHIRDAATAVLAAESAGRPAKLG
ncbi:MAG: pyridoxal phosphate-dependent decarboxylase family protein, partial [Planctomycetota bacterium]